LSAACRTSMSPQITTGSHSGQRCRDGGYRYQHQQHHHRLQALRRREGMNLFSRAFR
jgi:hypothetical protein